MVLFWLRTLTASTADCTIVKLQQPLRSTHKIEVVLVSGGGKSGGKSSQRDPVVLSWWCLWRWRPQSRAEYTMGVETKGDDEKVLRLRSMRCLTNLGLFGRERCVYMAKDANMAKRRGREMALRLILSMVVEGRVERRWGIWIGRKCTWSARVCWHALQTTLSLYISWEKSPTYQPYHGDACNEKATIWKSFSIL